ncbi:MAG: hypothetical protein NE334_09630 [Lentisphaeraceae bacterium]|nr:hypothetical protein [Lentisphaeraceae bacterium]
MSEDFEDYLKSQSLKKPSADLDDRVMSLFESKQELPEVKPFPWQKFASYAVAAMLFLAIGVTEFIERSKLNDSPALVEDEVSAPAVPVMKVNSSSDFVEKKRQKLTSPVNSAR